MALGRVHRGVGAAHQRLRARAVSRIDGDADAGEQAHALVAQRVLVGEVLQDGPGHDEGVLRPLHVGEKDDELVTTQAGGRIAGADHRGEPLGDDLQHPVPGVVPQPVVDALEAVEIDEEDGGPQAVARAVGHVLAQQVEEELAVGEAGQRVVRGHVVLAPARHFQLGHHPVPLDGVAQRAGEDPRVRLALHQVALRTALHGPQAHLLVVEPGEHHDGQLRRDAVHPPQGIQTVGFGEPQVEEDRLEGPGHDGGQGGVEVAGVLDLEFEPGGAGQGLAHQARIGGIVLDQEDTDRTAHAVVPQ